MRLLEIKAVVLTILFLSSPLAFSLPLTPDILYYRFDESGGFATVNHAVPGEGTNTAVVSGHTLGLAAGLSGNGLGSAGGSTNGDSFLPGSFVDTGWNTTLTGDWTLSFWLNVDNVFTNQLGYLFGDESTFDTTTGGAFRAFTRDVLNGDTNVRLRGVVNDVTIIGGAEKNGGNLLTWVYDSSSSEVRAYLNGQLNNTVPQDPVQVVSRGGSTFLIGGFQDENAMAFGAVMDEFRLYGSALSQEQVSELLYPDGRVPDPDGTVPAPPPLALLSVGLLALGYARKRRES